MRPRRIALLLAIAGLASVAGAQPLVLATSRTPLSLPVYVAQDKRYFAEEGVDVRLRDCIGGHRCLRMVLEGQAQVATTGDLPIVLNSFERSDYAVIGTLVTASNDVRLIAHPRAGVRGPEDLASKRLGVVVGSSSQYVVDIYLLTVGVDPRTLRILSLQPEEMLPALQAGQVDVVAIWDPFAYQALRALGPGVVELPSASAYTATFNLVVHRRLAGPRDDDLVRLLRAVERAERLIQEHPDEAKAILRARLGVEPAHVEAIWPSLSFRLGLDQGLLTTLESEARWALREGHVKGSAPIRALSLLHASPLKRVRPGAVGIDR